MVNRFLHDPIDLLSLSELPTSIRKKVNLPLLSVARRKREAMSNVTQRNRLDNIEPLRDYSPHV